jgi:flavin-dependent dehydrogenase
MSDDKRRRAVVVGGSIAGLVCARVLSDHFAEVIIIERDPRPEGAEPRKGAPQMRHVHAVLEAATRGLRELFPGIVEDLVRAGAMVVDAGADGALLHYGIWKPRFHSGIEALLCTRPLLEHHVRRRVEAIPSVGIRYEHTVEDLIATSDNTRITGVRVKGAGGEETLEADLVLDAAGRGTRVPRWLEALGFARPEEEKVVVDLAYTTRLYERPRDDRSDFGALVVYPRVPERRGAFVFASEGGRWLVSLTGYFGDHCPTDDEGFLAFARSLPAREVHDAIRDAKPVTAPVMHKIPSSRWFHYEKMRRFPAGLLPLGDSVCALNPVYGQGMTVAISCARELHHGLAALSRKGGDLAAFTRAFLGKQARITAMAWALSTTMDLRYPEAEGTRPPGLGAMQRVFADLIDVTSTDQRACKIFYEMMHQRRGPEALVHPDLLLPFLAFTAKKALSRSEPVRAPGPMPRAPQ